MKILKLVSFAVLMTVVSVAEAKVNTEDIRQCRQLTSDTALKFKSMADTQIKAVADLALQDLETIKNYDALPEIVVASMEKLESAMGTLSEEFPTNSFGMNRLNDSLHKFESKYLYFRLIVTMYTQGPLRLPVSNEQIPIGIGRASDEVGQAYLDYARQNRSCEF